MARCERKRGAEERIARDVLGEHVRRLAAAADDAGVLGAAAVDERRLNDALGVEAGEIEERAVDAVHRRAFVDDLGVPLATCAVEVPKGGIVRGDQHGRTRLGDAVGQPCGRGTRFTLQCRILLDLRLVALLQHHHTQSKWHERDRSDQENELE